jgi:transposase-like protein
MAIQEQITLLQFQKIYNDEEICREHMFKIRWAKGFICPHCGHTEYSNHYARHLYQCKQCGYQASVTAGTVMHRTHLPLQKWFWAIFLVSHDKRGVSAVRLQHELGISYPTAWLMLQKIRKAMGDRDACYKLAGLVELDETYFGGPKKGNKRGRGTEKTQVLVAVSRQEDGKPEYVKMAVTEDIKSESLVRFAEGNITAGSTISSDAYRSYSKAFFKGTYHHEPARYETKEGNEHLKWLHIIISNAKRFILGTYHGLDGTHFQAYLDEYCFRVNRRSFAAQLFDRLLCACSSTSTITYKMLVSELS